MSKKLHTVVRRPARFEPDDTIHLILDDGQEAIIDDTPTNREWSLTRNWQIHKLSGYAVTGYNSPHGTKTSKRLTCFVDPLGERWVHRNGNKLDCRLSNLTRVADAVIPFVPPVMIAPQPDHDSSIDAQLAALLGPAPVHVQPATRAPAATDIRDVSLDVLLAEVRTRVSAGLQDADLASAKTEAALSAARDAAAQAQARAEAEAERLADLQASKQRMLSILESIR